MEYYKNSEYFSRLTRYKINIYFFLKSSSEDMLPLIFGGGERERSSVGCLLHTLQPGMEPTTYTCSDRELNQQLFGTLNDIPTYRVMWPGQNKYFL